MEFLEDPVETNEPGRSGARALRIVIAGGNGQVGNILGRYLHARGNSVVALARTAFRAPWRVALWDGENLRDWVKELDGADVLINLVGRSMRELPV